MRAGAAARPVTIHRHVRYQRLAGTTAVGRYRSSPPCNSPYLVLRSLRRRRRDHLSFFVLSSSPRGDWHDEPGRRSTSKGRWVAPPNSTHDERDREPPSLVVERGSQRPEELIQTADRRQQPVDRGEHDGGDDQADTPRQARQLVQQVLVPTRHAAEGSGSARRASKPLVVLGSRLSALRSRLEELRARSCAGSGLVLRTTG